MKLIDVMLRAARADAAAQRALSDMYLGRGSVKSSTGTAPIWMNGGVLNRQELGPGHYTYRLGAPGVRGHYTYEFDVP